MRVSRIRLPPRVLGGEASTLLVRGPAPGTRLSGPAPGACFAGPRSPWPPPFAPPAPPLVAQPCSPASSLLWRGLTSPARASPATAPRLPDADRPGRAVGRETSRFPRKERPCMPGSLTTPGRQALALTRPLVWPSVTVTTSAPGTVALSRLDGRPARSPADASPGPSRGPTHGSGPVWLARPSLQRTSTSYSLPVSRRTTVGEVAG